MVRPSHKGFGEGSGRDGLRAQKSGTTNYTVNGGAAA